LEHVTERTYDYVTGNVLTEKAPDNVITEFTYDDFGTLTNTSTSALGQSQSVAIGWTTGTRPLGSVYYKQVTTSGAPTTKAYYDAFGRVLRTETKGFDGNLVYASTVYNKKGQVSESSFPYKQGDTAIKKVFIYDKYGRKTSDESDAGIISYSYSGKTVEITTSAGQSSSKTSDSQGNILSVSDDAGSIEYSYKSVGKLSTITSGGSSWSMEYDNLGRQTSLTDPDAGTISYRYNKYNELTKQIDARGKIDSLTYDVLGRVSTEVRNEGTKVYKYDPSGHPGFLDSVTFSGCSVRYNYDSASRITSKVNRIYGTSFSTGYGYDNYSRLQTLTYPSGFAIKNVYNASGYRSEVRRNDNNALIWQGQTVNAFGQFTQFKYGNNLITTKDYDCLGMLRNISAGSVQKMDYSFDYETGNLLSREDNLRSLTEIFTYDNLNRLSGVSGPASLTMSYSANGNISSKTSIGDYAYVSSKPHAVTSVTNPDGLISTTTQRITYTSFNKVDSIIQENLVYTLTYGDEDLRTMSRLYDNGNLQKTVYYVGGYEKEVKPGNHIRQLHYIASGDGLTAIFVRNDGVDTLYYIHTDHLGSINVITNQSGVVVKNYSFDAWGRRRNPENWTYANVPSTFLFSRGFTDHEHLDQFALINMNGRVYDPLLARMLSPDNFVQLPDFTQNFNRYTYCLNNPLIYKDPDGEIVWFVPILIGAAIFGTGNLVAHAIEGDIHDFGDALKYFGEGMLAGAALGAAWQFAPLIPWAGPTIRTVMNIYGATQLVGPGLSALSGLGQGIFTGDWSALGNAGKIFLGNFYLDENRTIFGAAWQGFSRHSWEFIQTGVGHSFAQVANIFGGIDNVDYFGGATLANNITDSPWERGGMTLSNFILGINLRANTDDWTFMHEYGHTLQSRAWGPIYGLFIAPASGLDYWPGNGEEPWKENPNFQKHEVRWYETGANRWAARYFYKFYNIQWSDEENPRSKKIARSLRLWR